MDHRALVTMSLPVSAFDSQEFRRALGRFPTGVTVIVAQTPEGSPVGLTASSFNSVSLSPPLVVWSLSRGSSSIRAFETCERYVIHVLAADQLGLAQRFAAGTQAEHVMHCWRHDALVFSVLGSHVVHGIIGVPVTQCVLQAVVPPASENVSEA
jgi:hypothetical protein